MFTAPLQWDSNEIYSLFRTGKQGHKNSSPKLLPFHSFIHLRVCSVYWMRCLTPKSNAFALNSHGTIPSQPRITLWNLVEPRSLRRTSSRTGTPHPYASVNVQILPLPERRPMYVNSSCRKPDLADSRVILLSSLWEGRVDYRCGKSCCAALALRSSWWVSLHTNVMSLLLTTHDWCLAWLLRFINNQLNLLR